MSFTVGFVLITQFLSGFGLMTRLRAVTTGYSLLGLSMLAGLGLSSGIPIILQLIYLPIAPTLYLQDWQSWRVYHCYYYKVNQPICECSSPGNDLRFVCASYPF
ncbi:hypothetical protein GO730_02875 [Spirosoma sp. HMF3257]|uniref:Uncharacterized protein n=1 Tax=Spirosoma telluris TaxID=2183553 RepID=A0A327NE83_9BACT|nr:hypothetical protein [Spirosoma telluris]RAI73621.1 hypothetical protein HMF3257_02810 [Spirosoma telluris]